MSKRSKLKIKETKLGRSKAWGLYYHGENLIEIDHRMRSKHYLSVLIHELLHHVFPWMSESMISKAAPKIAKGIWQQNYRKIAKCQKKK